MRTDKQRPLFAKDSERLIVDDENMKHVDLFGDIFPMAVVFIGTAGIIVYAIIRVIGMFVDL